MTSAGHQHPIHPTMIGTTPTMLGTTPNMLGTTPTVLGTTPAMLGATLGARRSCLHLFVIDAPARDHV